MAGLIGLGIASSMAQQGANIVKDLIQYNEYKKNQEYAKELQEELFQREDNLLQRRVADAIQAGVSPLAGLGIGGGPQVVSMPSYTPIESTSSAIADTIGTAEKLRLEEKAQEIDVWKTTEQIGLDREKLEKENERLKATLENNKEITKMKIVSAEKMNAINNAVTQSENELERELKKRLELIKDNTARQRMRHELDMLKERNKHDLEILEKSQDFEAKQRAYDRIQRGITDTLGTIGRIMLRK